MTVAEVLVACRDGDIRLQAAGERLRFDAPTGVLTPQLHEALRQHKPELLTLLASQFVTLRDGPTVPLPALQLAWSLESRGFAVEWTAPGDVRVSPADGLSAKDRFLIDHWRAHLAALTEYVERIAEEPL